MYYLGQHVSCRTSCKELIGEFEGDFSGVYKLIFSGNSLQYEQEENSNHRVLQVTNGNWLVRCHEYQIKYLQYMAVLFFLINDTFLNKSSKRVLFLDWEKHA
jgi:hypothetical protein